MWQSRVMVIMTMTWVKKKKTTTMTAVVLLTGNANELAEEQLNVTKATYEMVVVVVVVVVAVEEEAKQNVAKDERLRRMTVTKEED